jgi:hypothetical protein
MPTVKRRLDYFATDEGVVIEQALHQMMLNNLYNTESSYSADGQAYPDHSIPFVDKHKAYLVAHPSLDPQTYLANLRLMTKQRK